MSDKATNWKERRTKRLLVISASQVEVWRLCKRKWWLEQVRGLSVPPTGSQIFGTVTHQVAERFLRADDLGRDQNGRAVDLFPPGWEKAEGRFGQPSEGSASPAEQGIIRSLIPAAIESGVLQRLPGRKIEEGFRMEVAQLECPSCNGQGRISDLVHDKKCSTCDGDGKGTHIQLVGFIDLHHAPVEPNIQDHKTTSRMRYAKSPKALGENAQMLIYAKAVDDLYAAQQAPAPETFTLRHNVYCKDPDAPTVRKTEVMVRREVVLSHWDRVVSEASEMDRFRRTAERWSDLPDPTDTHACNAYGGCPFRTICGGQESEIGYQMRLDRYLEELNSTGRSVVPATFTPAPPATSEVDMSIFQKLGIGGGAAATQAPPPPINPSLSPIPAPPPPPAPGQLADRGNGEMRQVVHPDPAAQAAMDTTKLASPPPTALPPQPAPANGEALVLPPWHVPGCKACVTIPGFNSRGNPCRICDTDCGKQGKPASDKYIISPAGDGTCVWMLQADDTVSGRSAMTAAALAGQQPATKAQERVAPPPPPVETHAVAPPPPPAAPAVVQAPPPPPAAPVAPVAAPVTPPAPSAAPVEEKAETKGRGRPKKGFELLLGCAPITGEGKSGSGRGVVMLSQVMAAYAKVAVEEYNSKTGQNISSYYEINAFARRDWMAANVEKMTDDFKTDKVVVDGDGPDMSALTDAIIPHAGMVVVSFKQ